MQLTMNKNVFITCSVAGIGNMGAQVSAPAPLGLIIRAAA
jgi:hypothetical protein